MRAEMRCRRVLDADTPTRHTSDGIDDAEREAVFARPKGISQEDIIAALDDVARGRPACGAARVRRRDGLR